MSESSGRIAELVSVIAMFALLGGLFVVGAMMLVVLLWPWPDVPELVG